MSVLPPEVAGDEVLREPHGPPLGARTANWHALPVDEVAARLVSDPVRRDGTVWQVPAAELVPGDLVLLRAGDVVPADLRVVAAGGLLIDRSALTGESVPEPVDSAVVLPADVPLAERRTMAFQGT